MATIASPVPNDQGVVFHDVPWEIYVGLLKARGQGRVRLTYYRGVLEILTLSKLHEILSEVLGGFVKVIAREYGLEVQSVGSMTMHLEELEAGGETDKAYYIRHEEIVRQREKYDPAIDPPPDLAVEVDLSSSSSRRLLVFAELGIPEVWQYDGQRLVFKSLGGEGKYHELEQSLSFPGLSAAELRSFLDRRGTMGEIALDEELAKWLRAMRKSR
ncbi:MAG TPA: Uma2 family endonuclease [Pirellulales bacterium]|jgi:Uma2 family endonuclease|nr:Uma2 family endonuclease [Pirellulales bacterium]